MRIVGVWAPCALLIFASFGCGVAQSQTAERAARGVVHIPQAADEIPQPPSRVVEAIDESKLVALPGNTHLLARPKFDLGKADPQLYLERMQLVLKRSPEQEAALEKYVAEEYNPKSPNYHNWLTPERFGKLYGPSDPDIEKVTSWLENHGFQIYQVTRGRTHIEFSGTAEQVRQAFHTEIHQYLVRGEQHVANDTDPQIPSALAPVITGIASLHNFFPKHQSVFGRHVKRDPKTGKFRPVDPMPRPLYGFNDGTQDEEEITPYDFATIYNLGPLWKAGITGAGVKIAISAVTDIYQSDIDTFRQSFGLPASTVKVIHNGADPGVDKNSLGENTLDTEWSGAAAPGAQVVLVVSASTKTTFGGDLSNSYIVNSSPLVASTMSASYGQCEAFLGTAGNASINAIYQQGTAVGLSMFESSGDQGSTGCDNSDAAAPNPAQNGLQVNGVASSPYITAVGGTDFAWQGLESTYWSSTNASNGGNALGYIPEIPWNGTCASKFLFDAYFKPNFGATSTEEVCNDVLDFQDFLKVTGGSGGKSSCIKLPANATSFSQCEGGYKKPSWQTGKGVPADGVRDLPDVSLFASSGYPDGLQGSAYLICVASQSPDLSCNYTDPSLIVYQEVGGTSVSSPAMAGIMALVVQKTGANQGLANPVLYQLFGKETLSNCDSDSGNVKTTGNCIFNDITYGNNAQPCTAGRIDCKVSNSGDAYGIVSGYNSTTGYDYTTGLGSVNAYNLAQAWPKATSTAKATLLPGTLTFPSTLVGSTSAALVATLKNTGTVTLAIATNGISVSGTNFDSFGGSTTCGATLASGATCTISITFKPKSTGPLTAVLEVADNATGSPQKVTLNGTGIKTSSGSLAVSPASLSFPNTEITSTSEAQPVTIKNTGTAAVTLKSISVSSTSFEQINNCGASLAKGAVCTVFVAFKPASTAAFKGKLSVSSSASSAAQTVALAGMGTAKPSVSLSKASLTFGSIVEGKVSAAQTVTLTNKGKAPLDITNIALAGANASSYIELNTCGPTLAAGTSCNIDIAFKPTASGALKASLVISDNGSTATQRVTLAGTGAL